MKILLFVNVEKDMAMLLTSGICKIMDARQVDYTIFKAECDGAKIDTEALENIDVAFVLGGDGTMLHAIREVSRKGIPVLGINIGRLGFLTAVEYNTFEIALDRVVSGDYFIEERLLLQGITTKGQCDIAVNDICLISNERGKTIALSVKVNGRAVDEFTGDGVIVSSPTGSTGYSLSAGGPIVSPMADCIILTPICAHSLSSKPLVLCDCDKVQIKVKNNKTGLAIWDGQSTEKSNGIIVEKAVYKSRFIRFKDYNFFDVLSQKFNNNNR